MTDVLVAGLTLKLERVARQVKAGELAGRMGVSGPTLTRIEQRGAVQPEVAERYRKALATFPALATSVAPPSAA